MKRVDKRLLFGAPVLIVAIALSVLIATVGAENNDDTLRESPENESQVGEVSIEQIDVQIAESYPVQVFVDVEGYAPDPCWEVQEPIIVRDENRFDVEIMAERQADQMCPQVIEDYATTLELGSMEPGTYAISINGVVQEFEVH